MNIGIFDSGNGGRFVEEKLQRLLPSFTYVRVADTKHAPYGERTYEEITYLTDVAIQPLLATCPIIVLACNTATAAAIDTLRKKYPATTFIGFEPMIKPAASESKTKHLTLLATHATQHARRTEYLIADYAAKYKTDRPATQGWAKLIDNNQVSEIDLSEVELSIANGSDSIIIGCTHYIALIERIKKVSPNITIYEPTDAVAREISRRAVELQ